MTVEKIPDPHLKALSTSSFFKSAVFHDVQMSGLFDDSKTFADAIPKTQFALDPDYYAQKKKAPGFQLAQFVNTHFITESESEHSVATRPADAKTVESYIEDLWEMLKRSPTQAQGSLLALPHPYIVPGGRFREIYYWDSYFTSLGLVDGGELDTVEDMVRNFCAIQRNIGHIPNGNRSYYATRSHPPVLGLMVELLWNHKYAARNDMRFLAESVKAMEREHAFWMAGSVSLNSNQNVNRHVVRMPNGSVLNRYWDSEATPRPESYREDVIAAEHLAENDKPNFYRNIRAACASGWDFSSRWFKHVDSFSSIYTTDIVPIDLNCLLYKLEILLAEYHMLLGNPKASEQFFELSVSRHNSINLYLWDAQAQRYSDYCIKEDETSTRSTLASALALFVNIAPTERAMSTIETIKATFLKPGGLVTTDISSGQQWDSPNGWAPLQWFAVQGFLNYGQKKLAMVVMQRWVDMVEHHFLRYGWLFEKYDVCCATNLAGGGEYNLQKGFGWTNGVTWRFLRLLAELKEASGNE